MNESPRTASDPRDRQRRTSWPGLVSLLRFAAIAAAVLFIGLSLVGIVGVWLVDRTVSDVALKGFGLIENGVGVVNAGVERVDGLIAASRMEVRQTSETISSVGARPEANSAVLSSLNERLETSLAPRIAQIQQALVPVRDAIATIASAVSLLNSIPAMSDRAPRLATLDETLKRLEGLSADTTQLRNTLRALVTAQKGDVTAETVATLTELTQRIDARLGEAQTNVQEVQADITSLQARLATRKSQVLSVLYLLALLSTLLIAWLLYSQIVVIRHHAARVRPPPTGPMPGDDESASRTKP